MKVAFRLPSKKINYGYAEVSIDLDDGSTTSDIGKQYIKAVLDFQSAEIDAYGEYQNEMQEAEKLLATELGAKKVSEDLTSEPEAKQEAPWEKEPPKASEKPWENPTPQVNLF